MPTSDLLTATGSEPAQVAARPLRGATITALGTALPARAVSSREIAERVGVTEKWILTRTGISERRIASGPEEGVTALAVRAAREALQRAGLAATDIDLVIVASFSQDEMLPNAAPLVAYEIGAGNVGAFDIGAACTGFIAALATAAAQIESGRVRHALVIGSDRCSRFTDDNDRGTAALFADGAGAVVVSATDDEARIGPSIMHSDGSCGPIIKVEREEALIRMDGRETFRHAVERMSEVTTEVLERSGLTLAEIDLFIYHQANARILKSIRQRLELPEERVVEAIAMLGNTSSASIPLALAVAIERGHLARGARLLLAGFGAGFTWGGLTLTWDVDA